MIVPTEGFLMAAYHVVALVSAFFVVMAWLLEHWAKKRSPPTDRWFKAMRWFFLLILALVELLQALR